MAGQNEIDNIVNKCAYKDTVMAQLICANGNRIIGFADNGIYIYDGSQKPEEKKVIPVSAEIKSVFYDDSYFGIVTGDEKEKTRRLTVYDMSGSISLKIMKSVYKAVNSVRFLPCME